MGKRSCVVPKCSTKEGDKISLFAIPTDMAVGGRREQWRRILGVTEENLSTSSCVCRKHFDDADVSSIPNGSERLRPAALPKIINLDLQKGEIKLAHPIAATSQSSRKTRTEEPGASWTAASGGDEIIVASGGTTSTRLTALPKIITSLDLQKDKIKLAHPTSMTPQSCRNTRPVEAGASWAATSDDQNIFASGGTSTISDHTTSSGASSNYVPTPEQRFIMQEMTENFREPNPDASYLIMEENLRQLFKRCQECGAKFNKAVRFFTRGGHLRVETYCDGCVSKIKWHSYPHLNAMSKINLLLPTSVITSGGTFEKLKQMATGCNLSIPLKSEYNDVARAYIYPAIRTIYKEEMEERRDEIRQRQTENPDEPLRIAMDTRYNIPGRCAQFGTTVAIDLKTKKIIALVVTTKKIDAPSAPALELQGTKILLKTILSPDEIDLSESMDVDEFDHHQPPQQPIRLDTLVTDDHASIIKMMKTDQYKHINHQGDVWHFAKRVKKQLVEYSRTAAGAELSPWIRSISNFIWLICEKCDGDPDLLFEMWKSILNHVNGRHTWDRTEVFTPLDRCLHDEISEEKQKEVACLSRSSTAYRFLWTVVNDKDLISSLHRCSFNLQTSEVESFNSALLKNVPKHLSFGEEAFTTRTYMTALHFNENIGRAAKTTSTGSPAMRKELPPSTGMWVGKTALVEQTYRWRECVYHEIFNQRLEQSSIPGHQLKQRKFLTRPALASFIPKPPQSELVANFKKRRFGGDEQSGE